MLPDILAIGFSELKGGTVNSHIMAGNNNLQFTF